MEEKIKFNVENVNISDIMTQIHDKIENGNKHLQERIVIKSEGVDINDVVSEVYSGIKTHDYNLEDIKALYNFSLKAATYKISDNIDIQNRIENICSTVAIQYWWKFPKGEGLGYKLRVFRYKVMRKLTFFYMKHVVDQQNNFNGNVFEAIYGLADKSNVLESQNAELRNSIQLLESETYALKVQVQEQSKMIKMIADSDKNK